MNTFLDKINDQIHETEMQIQADSQGLRVARRNGNPDDLIFYASEVYALGFRLNAFREAKDMYLAAGIYREPDETSALAFDGNDLTF